MLKVWEFLRMISYFGVACASWATPGVSSGGDVRRCYSEMGHNSDIAHLLLDTTTHEDISRFCGRISFLKKCVAKFEHQLSNSENAEFLQKTQGISTFYLNVCPPGTDITEKYKSNANCFQRIRNKILSCGSHLPDTSSYRMKNNLKARCCALKQHRECISWEAADRCSKEAEDVLETLLTRYYRPQLEGCEEEDRPCQYVDEEGQDSTGQEGREVEGWHKTTLAQEWKRHKSKKHHNAGGREMASWWIVIAVYVALFLIK